MGDAAYRLAEAFCEQARTRVDELFRALTTNTDSIDRALAGAVMAGEDVWLERGVIDASEGTGPWIAETPFGPSAKENLRRRYR